MSSGSKRPWGPALALFLLSPIIGELLSGSSPPIEFFGFGWLFIVGLYGSGALIVRELAVRWDKGWASILVMGAAYGIIEEALEVKSFFDPGWVDIGPLGSYGRWAGVNWIWSIELTIFHCVFSIAIPILLVTLLYPSRSKEAWVKDRTLLALFLLLAFNVAFGFLLLTPYRPDPIAYAMAFGVVISLFIAARAIPKRWFQDSGREPARPRRFFFLGLGFSSALFLISWVMPAFSLPAILPIVLLICLFLGCLYYLLRISGNGRTWDSRHQLALAAGALSFLMTLALVQEAFGPPDMMGMSLVALAFALLLVCLWMRVSRSLAPAHPPEYRPSRA
jgi:hypothetical protein